MCSAVSFTMTVGFSSQISMKLHTLRGVRIAAAVFAAASLQNRLTPVTTMTHSVKRRQTKHAEMAQHPTRSCWQRVTAC